MLSITTRDELKAHVLRAYEHGLTINLDHCVYGPATGGNRGYIDETMSYYRLLAGHCALTKARIVMEVGTHYGGSTLALLSGIKAGGAADPLLVTMDVTDLNRERLAQEPEIHKIIGDSTELSFVAALASDLPSRDIDLLYIDALKDPGFVLTTLYNVHAIGVRPRCVILDDVQTNDEMRRFWDLLEAEEPLAFLLSRDFPHIRRPDMGYGIIWTEDTGRFMGSVRRLMEKLGLDTSRLGAGFDPDRFRKVKGLGSSVAYTKLCPRAPTTDSNAAELGTLMALAQTAYRGDGDIVDMGCFLGATTRALAEGLQRNTTVSSKFARITALDRFVFDAPSLEKSVAGRAALGETVLPVFYDAIAGHTEKINVVPFPTNTVRWCGRPIELMVAGAVRSPQINAHIIAEFVPKMMPGKSILVHRELLRHYRPFATYQFAYLADHFELIEVIGSAAVLGYKKPIPPDKVLRIVENRFSSEERVALVEDYIAGIADPVMKWAFQAQAAWVALKYEQTAKAQALITGLKSIPGAAIDTAKDAAIKKLQWAADNPKTPA